MLWEERVNIISEQSAVNSHLSGSRLSFFMICIKWKTMSVL
jgi:hypothetical protein